MESSQQGPPNLSVSPCHYYFRWASTSNSSLGGLFFFCWYLAYEYHTPPVVLMTNPVTFKACTCTPPSRTKPRVVDPTPLRTPTMVVVRAELTMVHKNMVKLRTMPITNERTRITKKYNELLCKQRHGSLLDQLKRNLRFARTLLLINHPWEISQYIYKHIQLSTLVKEYNPFLGRKKDHPL